MTAPVSVSVSSGVAVSAKSTSTTPGDHVGVFNLAADGGKKRVGPFAADDLFGELDAERLDVGAVREAGVGHDGGGIGIDENDFVAVGLEGLAGLRAGIIEFAGLPDDDGAGADDEDAVEVGAARHQCPVHLE